MSRAGFVPWAWALSPLVTALLLTLNGPAPRAPGEPVAWSLAPDDDGTVLPTPAAARAALRDELPSGRVLYQRIDRLVVRDPAARREPAPVLVIELAAPGGEILFQALRSPFFGAADPPLAAALSASLAQEQGARRLAIGEESAEGLGLTLEGGPPYAAVSLIGRIDLALPAATTR